MHATNFALALLLAVVAPAAAFTGVRPAPRRTLATQRNAVEMNAGNAFRGAAVAAALALGGLQAPASAAPMYLAETETRQGLYKEYTVEKTTQQVRCESRAPWSPRRNAGGNEANDAPDRSRSRAATNSTAQLHSTTTRSRASRRRRRRRAAAASTLRSSASSSSVLSSSRWRSTGGTSRTTSPWTKREAGGVMRRAPRFSRAWLGFAGSWGLSLRALSSRGGWIKDPLFLFRSVAAPGAARGHAPAFPPLRRCFGERHGARAPQKKTFGIRSCGTAARRATVPPGSAPTDAL